MNELRNILTIGTTLHGKDYVYEVEKVLGQGSFGITYLAKVCLKGALGTLQGALHVAIKEFYMKEMNSRSGTAVDSGKESRMFHSYREKFRKEALNLSRMNHPGIVKVLEVFDENNTSYIVMEYLTGGTLDATIKEKTKLDEAEAIETVSKIGLALSYMHDQRMLHLDLKPQNVMFDNAKQPVLIDFGLSKHFEESGEPESSTSIGLGTPGYAPIEQVDYTGGAEFQPTLDIYALGATLYKSLTGQTPPTASTVLNRPTLLNDRLSQAGVSEGCRNVVLKAMQPLRNARPQTVKEFLALMNDSQHPASVELDNDDESTLLPTAKDSANKNEKVVEQLNEQKGNESLSTVGQGSSPSKDKPMHQPEIKEDEETVLMSPARPSKVTEPKRETENPVAVEKKNNDAKPVILEKPVVVDKPVVDEKKEKKASSSSPVEKKVVKEDKKEQLKKASAAPKAEPVKVVSKQPESKKELSVKADLPPIGTGPIVDFANATPVYMTRFGAIVTAITDLDFYEDMAIVQQNGKYGYVNRDGQLVFSCRYDEVEVFWGGYASVKSGGLYGLIDRSGKEIIPCSYEEMVECHEGLILLCRNGKWGFVDLEGRVVIPYEYEAADVFINGYAPVKKNNCWGYIDTTGRVVIPLDYQDVEVNDATGPLYALQSGMKWGYVNRKGEKVIPFKYENASTFIDGLANVQYGGKWGLINEEGFAIVPFDYTAIYHCMDTHKWIVEKNNKIGLLDLQGHVIVPCTYSYIGFYICGLCSVQKNNKYGFIDADGKEVIPAEYDWSARYFVGGKAIVAKEGRYFVIDTQGKVVRNLDYKWVAENRFYKDWLLACYRGQEGVIDFKGDVVLPFAYQDIHEMEFDGYYKVRQNQKYGCLDGRLNEVIKPIYTFLEDSFSEGTMAAGRNGTFGFINKKGEDVIPFTYENLSIPEKAYWPFKNGIARINGKIINRDNQEVTLFEGHRYFRYLLDVALVFVFGFMCRASFGFMLSGIHTFGEVLFDLVAFSGLAFSIRRLYKDERQINSRNGYRLVTNVFSNGISNAYQDAAYLVSRGLLAVCKNEKWGFINKRHEEVIPTQYRWVSVFDNKKECWAIKDNSSVVKLDITGKERSLTSEERSEWDKKWGIF